MSSSHPSCVVCPPNSVCGLSADGELVCFIQKRVKDLVRTFSKNETKSPKLSDSLSVVGEAWSRRPPHHAHHLHHRCRQAVCHPRRLPPYWSNPWWTPAKNRRTRRHASRATSEPYGSRGCHQRPTGTRSHQRLIPLHHHNFLRSLFSKTGIFSCIPPKTHPV